MLRESSRAERKRLYAEAYSAVSELRVSMMAEEPEKRTAGTSEALASSLIRLCNPRDYILELGCGRGYTCLKLAPYVASMVGSDVADPVLNEARELLRENQISNVKILKGSADELMCDFDEGSFDKVISIDVYEHLHPEDAVTHLSEVYSVLKPKGEYIIVTPNRLTGPHDVTKDLLPDAEEPLGFHLNETTYSELIQQMRTVGFAWFRSVMPLSFKLPVPIDIVSPSIFNIWVEKQYLKTKGNFFIDKCCEILINRIFLIARKC